MAIHQHPTLKAVEVAKSSDRASMPILSQLPSGIFHPTQIRTAITDVGNRKPLDSQLEADGTRFALSSSKVPQVQDIPPADLFVVPLRGVNAITTTPHNLIENLTRMTNQGAMVIVATNDSTFAEEAVTPRLKAKGFKLLASVSSDEGCVSCYKDVTNEQPHEL